MTKRIVLAWVLVVGQWAAYATEPQGLITANGKVSGAGLVSLSSGLSLSPGWTYLQDFFINNSCTSSSCSTSGATVYFPPQPLTSGSVRVAFGICGGQTSRTSFTTMTINGVAMTEDTTAEVFDSGVYQSVLAYGVGTGGTGQPIMSFTISPACASGTLGMWFIELLPPSGYTASRDTSNSTFTTSSCTTCTGAALTLGGTDGVLHFGGWSTYLNGLATFSSPYFIDQTGEIGIGLNVTSGTAPTVTMGSASSGYGDSAIAFKSTAGNFTGPTTPFTLANYSCAVGVNCAEQYSAGTAPTNASCNPSCTLSIASTTSGNAGVLVMASAGAATLSSATVGGNSLTVPTGANTCQGSSVNSGGTTYQLTCGYILSLPNGATSISATMSASVSAWFAWFEFQRPSGSWTLDAQNSASNSASYTPKGSSLTITGTNDVFIHCLMGNGGQGGMSVTPGPMGALEWSSDGACGVLLNSTNTQAPYYIYQNDAGTPVIDLAFK